MKTHQTMFPTGSPFCALCRCEASSFTGFSFRNLSEENGLPV